MSCDARRDAAGAGLLLRGTRLIDRRPACDQARMTGGLSVAGRWKRIVMRASGLLAPLLATVLVISGAPGTRVVKAPPAPAIHRAAQTFDQAYRVAAASGRWDALLEVGDAARRAGDLAGSPETADARAREIYRAALAQARQRGSLDGVLRVAEAFIAVGDREGAVESIRIAEVLAGRDPEARADVRAVASQLTGALC
jgi:hypothetical protein